MSTGVPARTLSRLGKAGVRRGARGRPGPGRGRAGPRGLTDSCMICVSSLPCPPGTLSSTSPSVKWECCYLQGEVYVRLNESIGKRVRPVSGTRGVINGDKHLLFIRGQVGREWENHTLCAFTDFCVIRSQEFHLLLKLMNE